MIGALVETTGWVVVCCGIWLATLSSVTVPEVCFAVASSIPCGIVARAGRRSLDASWRFRASWMTWIAPVVATLVAETGELLRMSVGGPHTGRLTTIELPDEEHQLADGREALASLALCSTPGTIVVDNDPDTHRMTAHELVSRGPDLASVVGR
jgi:multisubunit Na+/H+ antiporter MnhE subunit